jgi:hypothetical protein
MRVSPARNVINPQHKGDRGGPIIGGCLMFRMIFAIIVGVMEKTPRRSRDVV